ncbi:hypothetical protein Plo01_37760 [Planobispora longispora]|uniref:Uncharacterized protein n=1 Tax=Planobispora longispora TaxID=28887 RepID=A0A8J3RKF9_9ACTN|nr:hypothetical protein GCM10020093_060980 [Planobispora longispora]GIH77347.1 hypothetical protein Plo01_37760 [Planobispora longispora]
MAASAGPEPASDAAASVTAPVRPRDTNTAESAAVRRDLVTGASVRFPERSTYIEKILVREK